MPLKDLVETECGGSNSLIQFTSHYTIDKGFAEEGIKHPFQSSQNDPVNSTSERCFHMGTLLEKIQDIAYSNSPLQTQSANNERQDCISDQLVHSDTNNKVSIFEHHVDDTTVNVPFQELQQHELEKWNKNYNNDGNLFLNWTVGYNQKPFNSLIGGINHLQQPLIGPCETWIYGRTLQLPEYNIQPDKLREAAANVVHVMESEPNFKNCEFLDHMRELSGHSDAGTLSTIVNSERHQYNKWADENPLETSENHSQFENDYFMNTTADDENTSSADNDTFSKNLWSKLTQKWQMLHDMDEDVPLIGDSMYLPSAAEYKFCDENPMLNCDDAIKEGRKRLRMGDLPGAVLCFEAAVQKDKQNIEGWLLLGKAQAENEQDPKAIAALSACIKLDNENLDALMAIAASFTNENYHYQACLALKEWLKHNPKYSYLVRNYEKEKARQDDVGARFSSMISQKFYENVLNLYEKAIFQQSYDGLVDADVQNGMGILYTLNNDHDKATEYFKTAVHEKNNDASLWNRLGATLANASKPGQALEAYRNALTLSPGFIRARYNLGITCLHLNNYKEAIENLLMALNLQVSGRGLQGEKSEIMSDSIWGTLRLALSLSEYKDLLPFAVERNLTELINRLSVNRNMSQE